MPLRFLLSFTLALWPFGAGADTVTLFAAASLKTVIDALQPLHAEATGDELRAVYAGSPALARQIEAGAPADLVILANEVWMDRLETQGTIRRETRRDLLSNRIVLVAPAPATPLNIESDLHERLGTGRLAMAIVDAVPAGIYGRQSLEAMGLWDQVAPQVVQTDNVRAALGLVSAGAVAFGIVYATDAIAEPRVTAVAAFDPSTHDPIRYPVAAVTDDPATERALDFLTSPEARAVFADAGFDVLE